MNSCNVLDNLLELLATMPWSTTGCCGISTSILPTVKSAELWSFVFLLTDEYKPCDLPTFTVTTVLCSKTYKGHKYVNLHNLRSCATKNLIHLLNKDYSDVYILHIGWFSLQQNNHSMSYMCRSWGFMWFSFQDSFNSLSMCGTGVHILKRCFQLQPTQHCRYSYVFNLSHAKHYERNPFPNKDTWNKWMANDKIPSTLPGRKLCYKCLILSWISIQTRTETIQTTKEKS